MRCVFECHVALDTRTRARHLSKRQPMPSGREAGLSRSLAARGIFEDANRVRPGVYWSCTPPRPAEINPWFYPSASEYATLLETNGLEVRFITLFDRPTPLADGEAGMKELDHHVWFVLFFFREALCGKTRFLPSGESKSCSTPECFRGDGQ